jgi:hypothetical protein
LSCPICEKRKAKRYCPAKGEKICAVCCGEEREVTIDCPTDCPYLVAARKYEDEHRKPIPPEEVPYLDVEFPPDLIHEHRSIVSGLAYHILKVAVEQPSLMDSDVLEGIGALAETFRTLGTGIYYEKPPESALPRMVYEQLANFIAEIKKQVEERAGYPALKDSEIFYLLVFLLRVGRGRTNARPKSRAYLDFLRAQFPRSAELQREAPRIVMP